MGIIKSILENDLYKFSQTYYYQMMYPEGIGTFSFKDRNNTKYDDKFLVLLNKEFKELESLSLTDEECEWAVANIPFIPRHYWEWLKTFRFKSDKIKSWIDNEKRLHIVLNNKQSHKSWNTVSFIETKAFCIACNLSIILSVFFDLIFNIQIIFLIMHDFSAEMLCKHIKKRYLL